MLQLWQNPVMQQTSNRDDLLCFVMYECHYDAKIRDRRWLGTHGRIGCTHSKDLTVTKGCSQRGGSEIPTQSNGHNGKPPEYNIAIDSLTEHM